MQSNYTGNYASATLEHMKYAVLLVFIGVLCYTFIYFFSQNKNISIPRFQVNSLKKEEKQTTTILLGGDVMLGRSVTVQALDTKHDPLFPFLNLQPLFDDADIIFVNLENPIVRNCPRQTAGMVFCAPPEMIDGLPAPQTIANLANNHSGNHGSGGLVETKKYLSDKNILNTGQSELISKTIHGITFGFLGFDKDQQSNPVLLEKERTLVTESDAKVDVLVVAMHWGIEYQSHPTDGQRKLANELVSLGANVVVGHHPHWVQDIEWIGTTPVYYSLGNLIFDQMWSEETRHGLLVKLTFEGKNIEKQELIPTYIKAIGQPIIMPSPKE